MRSPTELTVEFRSMGLKVTPQRRLLFGLLHDNTTHPTAEQLFELASEQTPGISLRTVYQTLTDLTEMGEIHTLTLGGAARFDPNTGAHHHLVCSSCGEVTDVYVDGDDRLLLVDPPTFAVASTDIVFRGHCGGCACSTMSPPTSIPIHVPEQVPSLPSNTSRRSQL